ncbi:hypothetical protein ACRYJU_18795 [Alloalcanivorax xenomutans]|uniref:hypothetical protein n=1 Tax=Alloalcanivorax xenomutans TaxID=1094342 RepID=UPI000BC60C88|nr:hypothetical protein [Alloalcanivorax xenomutans]SOC07363.1 hypothetical protein SAMN05877962_108106 [Alloalcanivorax xenomutans]
MRSLITKMLRPARVLIAGGALLALQGCGMIYKTTGDILVSFGQAELLPYMLAYDDVRMGCIMGEAQTPLLMSFETVGSHPGRLGVMTFVTSAVCAEQLSLESELRYLRAMKEGRVAEAQDARIEQKRWSALAAERLLTAYQRLEVEYGKLDEGECPKLNRKLDQLVWLVGNIAGAQALVADGAADGVVGVPRDIVGKVARNASCLSNENWWGAPEGLRATIWNLLPQLAPEGAQPWPKLEQSAEMGFEKGVRLGSAFLALSAYSKGDNDRLRKAIRDFAANDENLDPDYAMIDAIASVLIQGLSDRMWTEATGKRTPVNGLGTFWDDQPSSGSKVDIDDLL